MGDSINQKRAEDVLCLQQSGSRSYLSPKNRQKIVEEIIKILRNHCKDPKILPEVRDMARRFEQSVFTMALNEHDYLRRISLKMMTIQGNSENAANSSVACSASVGPSHFHSAIEVSSSRERYQVAETWREEIFQRVTAMKSKYLSRVDEMHSKTVIKLKQVSLQPENPSRGLFQKRLNDLKLMLERLQRLLNIPKEKIIPEHGANLDRWEQIILYYLSKFFPKSTNTVASRQQGQGPCHDVHSLSTSSPPQSVQLTVLQARIQQAPQTDSPSRNSNHESDLQKTISGTPSVSDCNNREENLGNNTNTTSDKRSVSQSPIQLLLNTVSSISSRAFKSSTDDICSVMAMIDGMEATAPRITSKAAVGQDLVGATRCWMQARNLRFQEVGTSRAWKTRECLRAIPTESSSDGEVAAENNRKMPSIGPTRELFEEIECLNQRLIDLVVDVCKEDMRSIGVGTVVECRFVGVSVNLGFVEPMRTIGHSSIIQPIRLLVPTGYPDCSPVVLDKLPSEMGDDNEDLSKKARSRLRLLLRGLKNPISLSEMARTWEVCAREVIIEYAEKYGGGSFSSRYGTWENRESA